MKKIFLLFCAAAGWLGAQAQTEALELPFYETFPDTVDVDAEDAQWTVLDNNGDGISTNGANTCLPVLTRRRVVPLCRGVKP